MEQFLRSLRPIFALGIAVLVIVIVASISKELDTQLKIIGGSVLASLIGAFAFRALRNRRASRPLTREEISKSADTLEPFMRALMSACDTALFDEELVGSVGREVLHAYALGAVTALAVDKGFSQQQGLDTWKELVSRLFSYTADEASARATILLAAVKDGTLQNEPLFHQGIAGFKHWQRQQDAREPAEIFSAIVTHSMLCALCSGGDGRLPASAVVVRANDSLVGVQAEYAWIASRCGAPDSDWQLRGQRLAHQDGKAFDVITIALSNGQSRTFFFDITSFFGKRG